jgi:hypothetical protein
MKAGMLFVPPFINVAVSSPVIGRITGDRHWRERLMVPVSSAAVHALNDRDAAHGSALPNVNHQISAAIGIAGCSILLAGLSELGAVHACTVVLAVSAGIGALALIPAAFLPKKTHP